MSSHPSSPTFCVLPWLHVAVRPNGMIKPCCRFGEEYDPKLFEGMTLSEILHSPLFAEIRSKKLRGERVAGCETCYQVDGSGAPSLRVKKNKDFQDTWEKQPRLTYLELALGNLCNLRCRGCSSPYSTKWIATEQALQYNPE